MLQKIPATYEEEEGVVNLAPCPFCGKDVAIFSNCQELELCETFEKCPAENHYHCVVCSYVNQGCGSSSGFYPTYREAAAAWNKRAGCLSMADVERALESTALGGDKDPQDGP